MWSSNAKSTANITGSVPEISVYLPTHNRRTLLERAVNSVLAQTYHDFELLIVDDGSTDDIVVYLEKLDASESKVTIFRNEISQGAGAARNRAIRAARGKFVTGIDDDDEFLPQRLQQLLDAYTGMHSFVASALYWDSGKTRKARSNLTISKAMMFSRNCAGNQVLARKQDLIDVGLFDEVMVACEDWDLWTRLVMGKGDGLKIAQPLYLLHTAHSGDRISTTENVIQGRAGFYEKHHAEMSSSNKKDSEFFLKRARGEQFSLQDVIRLSTHYNAKQLLTQYARSHFPTLTNRLMKRLPHF